MSREESVILKLDSERGLLHYNNENVSGVFDLTQHFNVNGAKYEWGRDKSTVQFQSIVTITTPPTLPYEGQGIFKIADHKVANKLMVSINLANFYGTHPTLIQSDDRFRLARFTEKYNEPSGGFRRALEEIKGGRKDGCWFWWFVPTPPFIKHGVEIGRKTNQIYAIRDAFSIEEENNSYKMERYMSAAKAFLSDSVCRRGYNDMISAIMMQLNQNNYDVIGEDIHKLVPSLEMFRDAAESLGSEAQSETLINGWENVVEYYKNCLLLAEKAKEARKSNQPLSNPIQFGTTQFQYMKGSVVNFGKEFSGVTPDKMAIVNAANIGGLGGGAVDGSITSRGGDNLRIDRAKLPKIQPGKRINVGGAVITGRKSKALEYGRLHVNNVIHAVGPNFAPTASTSDRGTIEDLKSAYRASLQRCIDKEITHVGFCPLSAGVFKGNEDLGSIIKTGEDTIREFLEEPRQNNRLQIVHFILFDDKEIAAVSDRLQ